MLSPETLSYIAGLIDLQGIIRVRVANEVELPYVALSGPNSQVLRWLDEVTGTRTVITRRNYYKTGCSEHCAERHQHIQSVSGRWSLTGAKATVLLWNIRPYLRVKEEECRAALVTGFSAKYKPATLVKMRELGWTIPEWSMEE